MPIITRSGVRISTDSKFETYTDTMVSGEQTQITVGTLEPSTTYYAKGIAESGGNIYISDNAIQFKTLERVVRYMTLTATAPNSTVELANYGTNATTTAPKIWYSRDLVNWTPWDFTTITLDNIGDEVHFYGENPHGIAHDNANYSTFVMSGQLEAKGDVTSLLSTDGISDLSGMGYGFYSLFENCTSLVIPPELPSIILTQSCYSRMFKGCTGLKVAPMLPAMTLDVYCYERMFLGCSSLKTAPSLPAKTLANNCYQYMFYGCTSLESGANISSTEFPQWCCDSMYQNCTSLVTAPSLTVSTLQRYACQNMFKGCSALKNVPTLNFSTVNQYACQYMFDSCTSLVTAPSLTATYVGTNGFARMFSGCTSLITAPELTATNIATSCYENMFNGCTSLVNPPSVLPNPSSIGDTSKYFRMFYGCTSLTHSPIMEIDHFNTNDSKEMYYGCSALTDVTCLATSISASSCTYNWLSGVAASGTFYKNASTSWSTGTSGVPSGWTVVDYVP